MKPFLLAFLLPSISFAQSDLDNASACSIDSNSLVYCVCDSIKIGPCKKTNLYKRDKQISKCGTFKQGKIYSGLSFKYDSTGYLLETEQYYMGRKKGSCIQKKKFFTFLDHCPLIIDSVEFIRELRNTIELKNQPINYAGKGKISYYQKIILQGSSREYTLIEYTYGSFENGPMVDHPYKYQVLIDPDDHITKILSSERFELISILKEQAPFLLTLTTTAKGNGSHQVYRVNSDTLQNILLCDTQTYDGHEDHLAYEPNELKPGIKDVNNDGFNDLVFSGTLVYVQGLTKSGIWFDSEMINGKEVTYSIDRPFKKTPIEIILLYDRSNGMLIPEKDYAKKYGSTFKEPIDYKAQVSHRYSKTIPLVKLPRRACYKLLDQNGKVRLDECNSSFDITQFPKGVYYLEIEKQFLELIWY